MRLNTPEPRRKASATTHRPATPGGWRRRAELRPRPGPVPMVANPPPAAAQLPPPAAEARPAGRASGWSTASFGNPPDTSPLELHILGEHLARCRGAGGRWFAWRCRAETLRRLAATHIVTTLVVFALLVGAALLVV